MAEPTSTSAAGIAALFAAMLGPTFGPYAVIIWASLAGAMWPLAKRKTASRFEATTFVLRVVATATIVTMPLAFVAETKFGVPAHHALGLVALGVGMAGDEWPKYVRMAASYLFTRLTGRRTPDTEKESTP